MMRTGSKQEQRETAMETTTRSARNVTFRTWLPAVALITLVLAPDYAAANPSTSDETQAGSALLTDGVGAWGCLEGPQMFTYSCTPTNWLQRLGAEASEEDRARALASDMAPRSNRMLDKQHWDYRSPQVSGVSANVVVTEGRLTDFQDAASPSSGMQLGVTLGLQLSF